MTRVAILGAGNVGAALGKGWARAGHTIVYGVPAPGAKHANAARDAGNAKVLAVSEAVRDADVIVLAVPWHEAASAVQACGNLTGRILIDVTNPLEMTKDGLGLALGFDTSGGETVASLAPGAFVFKTLNQVGYAVMDDASGYVAPPTIFVASDDAANKPVVMQLVRDLGFEALDAGPLRIARLLEPMAMLWIDQALNRGAAQDNAFAFLKRKTN